MCLLAVRVAVFGVVLSLLAIAAGMVISGLAMVMRSGFMMTGSLMMLRTCPGISARLSTLAPNLLVKFVAVLGSRRFAAQAAGLRVLFG